MLNNLTIPYNIHVKHNKNSVSNNKYFSTKYESKDEGKISHVRHFPPAIREWNNSIYNFNKNNSNYSVVKYNQLDNLLKNYFNITNNKRTGRSKRMRYLRKKLRSKKTFLSKPEIKQTNDKIIITVYSLDRIKQLLTRKLFFFNRPNFYDKLRIIKKKKLWRKIKNRIKYKIPHSGIRFLKELKTFRKNYILNNRFTQQNTTFLFFKYILSIFNIGIYIANYLPPRRLKRFDLLLQKKLERSREKQLKVISNSNIESLIWINNITWSVEKLEKKTINYEFLQSKFIKEKEQLENINKMLNFKYQLNYKLIEIISKCINLPAFINKATRGDKFIMNKIFNHINIKLKRFKIKRIYKRKTFFISKVKNILWFNIIKYKKLLPSLKRFIDNLYNKKTELNIVNLKYFLFNSDIYTQILITKLRKKVNPLRMLKKIFSSMHTHEAKYIKRANKNNNLRPLFLNEDLSLKSLSNYTTTTQYSNIPKIFGNITKQRSKINKTKDLLNSIIKRIYPKDDIYFANKVYEKISRIDKVLDNIKYKKLVGIKLEINGRLNRRNTASRSIKLMEFTGKLRDKESYKYLNKTSSIPTIILRNSMRSNTMHTSKGCYKRTGAFGMKTWIATK